MITLKDVGDRFNRQQVTVSRTAPDNSSDWRITLLSSDLSNNFVNNLNRQVNLSLVDGTQILSEGDADSLLIPLEIIGVRKIANKLKVYYRHKFQTDSTNLLNITLNCFILQDRDMELPNNPHALISFLVAEQSVDQQTQSPHQQQFTRTDIVDDLSLDLSKVRSTPERVHVDKGENSNGGLDLPVGEQKDPVQEEQREHSQFNYVEGKAIPEKV